jgi:hypothetical protein
VIQAHSIARPDSLKTLAIKQGNHGRAMRSLVIVVATVIFDPGSLPAAQQKDNEAVSSLVQGIIARSEAIFSGRIDYHMTSGFTDLRRTMHDSDYHFSFSGASWALRYSTGSASVSHKGKFIEHALYPQNDGRVDHSASVELPLSVDRRRPCPPFFAGTFWFKDTVDFVRTNAKGARLVSSAEVNGVKTEVLEWQIPIRELKAFRGVSVERRLRHPGLLRVFVAPEYGYSLLRIQHLSGEKGQELDQVFHSSDFKEVAPGIFFPNQCKSQSYNETGQPSYYVEYAIHRVEKVNEEIPEEDFIVKLPAGTSVTDARSPKEVVSFRVGQIGGIPEDLEEVMQIEGQSSVRRTWVNAILIGSLVAALIVTSLYVFRRWRYRPTK